MPKLLLDLDRTLFDTPRFVETLWRWLGQAYRLDDVEAVRETGKDYYTYVGDMYSYDFFAHVADLGIDKTDLIRRARQEFSGATFVYADVPGFLTLTTELDRAILTFGESTYQDFKLLLCPELHDLVVHNTMRPKHEYIETHYPNQEVVLIDDKLQAGELSENVRFIHIDRIQEQSMTERHGYVSVNSLAVIEKRWLP